MLERGPEEVRAPDMMATEWRAPGKDMARRLLYGGHDLPLIDVVFLPAAAQTVTVGRPASHGIDK
jgi:hypothetical protein